MSKQQTTALPENSAVRQAIRSLVSKKNHSETVILVAGAAGFVGSQLAKNFCELGISVIGLDNFITGSDEQVRMLNKYESFELIQGDINEALPNVLLEKNITHIVHVMDIYPRIKPGNFRLNELLVNSHGLRNLLDLANQVNARFVYTSSVDIYQGLASHEYLRNYYDGEELTSYYAFLEAKRFGESLCREYSEQFGVDARIARLPFVYGPGVSMDSNHLLVKATRLATVGKDLILNEEGSREHNLLYLDDAVYGLIKLTLSEDPDVQNSIFYFTNPERVSTLSIAYLLQSLVPGDIAVDFIPQHRKVGWPDFKPIDLSRTEKYLKWRAEVELSDGVARMLQACNVDPQDDSPFKEAKATKAELASNKQEPQPEASSKKKVVSQTPTTALRPQKTRNLSPFMMALPTIALPALPKISLPKVSLPHLSMPTVRFRTALVTTIVVLLLVTALSPLALIGGYVHAAWGATKDGDFVKAQGLLQRAASVWPVYEGPAHVVGLQSQHDGVEALFDVGQYGVRLLQDVRSVATFLLPVKDRLLLSWQGADIPEELQDNDLFPQRFGLSSVYWKEFQQDYGVFSEQVKGLRVDVYPKALQGRLRDVQSLVGALDPTIEHTDELLLEADALLGFQEPKRYLVLLQNNNEIRATGGFIGSYIVFEVINGEITFFKVDDIYNPDGLLQPHQDPEIPFPIRKYLDQEYLGARDANWWSHFPTSAQNIITLYERSTNENVDGVFALNLSVVQELLKEVGPVYLERYQETVTADNVFERAQLHAEIGFKPGSMQKRDYLAELTETLLPKLSSGDRKYAVGMGKVILESLTSGDIIAYAVDDTIQDIFESMEVAGVLSETTGDYLRVVDSNVGGNKSNYWVDRTTHYSVDIDREGYLIATVKVRWNHRGDNASWPNGDYENYVRVYVPQEISGIEVSPRSYEQNIYEEDGKTVIASYVDVPINSSREIQIRYVLPSALQLGGADPYTLLWEKQPGMIDEEITFDFNLPVFLRSNDVLEQSTILDRPKRFSVEVIGTEAIERGLGPVE